MVKNYKMEKNARKYTNLEVYEKVKDMGEIELYKILFKDKYFKYLNKGSLKLMFRFWGTSLASIPFLNATLQNIQSGNAGIIIYYTPLDKYNYQRNNKGYYDDNSEYDWSGKEMSFDELERSIMSFTYEEQIKILGRPFYDNPNAEKGIMSFKFESLGSIETGNLYYTLNGQDKKQLELSSMPTFNFGSYNGIKKIDRSYSGIIESDSVIKSLIFTVEKDGLILEEYNFLEYQSYKELGWHNRSHLINFNITNIGSPDYRWKPSYSFPMASWERSWSIPFMHMSADMVNKLNIMIKYAEHNPNDVSDDNKKLLKIAKNIINKHAGYLAEPNENELSKELNTNEDSIVEIFSSMFSDFIEKLKRK